MNWTRIFGAVLVSLLSTACEDEQEIVVPNRVLDRPTDTVLACVKLEEETDRVRIMPASECSSSNRPDCDHQVIGLVANSERNEIALWRRCDVDGLVDLDPGTPGYNFLPAGELPTRMAITDDACRAVTSNFGSCDFTVVDVQELASYAVDLVPTKTPSSLVSTLNALDPDGLPLATRTGDIIAVPRRLSRSSAPGSGSDDDGGDADTGGDPGGGGDSGGGSDVSRCDPDDPDSVIVTFPSCHLVAEVDVLTQQILQSRQFLFDDEGGVEVIDPGTDPECPIDCPAKLAGDLPDEGNPQLDGIWPMTVALVPVPDEEDCSGLPEGETPPEDCEIEYDALFVAGTRSDMIFEIELTEGLWAQPEDIVAVELADAGGIHAIRPTPVSEFLSERHQFLYAIAGDGSTRVVRRDLAAGVVGIECDTQPDPTAVGQTACQPVDPLLPGDPPDRRPLAVGPGIRSASGGTFTDWTFQFHRDQECASGGDDELKDSNPFCGESAVVGIGVTSQGRVVMSTFGQFVGFLHQAVGDRLSTMDIEVRPHMLWPVVTPDTTVQSAVVDDAIRQSSPRVRDEDPARAIPDDSEHTAFLAPSLRRIDLAYAPAMEGASASQDAIARAFGVERNEDELGSFTEGAAHYNNSVVRMVSRDYRQVPTQGWALVWEGDIPRTASSTGRFRCEAGSEGWGDGTCIPSATGDSELKDESATFCQAGVLAGDKVVVSGCVDDDDCGLGQTCLRESSATTSASGICVSEAEDADGLERLREICAPFISDPCGEPIREFRIVEAYQDRLVLHEMDIPYTSFVRSKADPEDCPGSDDDEFSPACIEEHHARFVCAPPDLQPDGGCDTDEDCRNIPDLDGHYCIEGVCRRPCMRASESETDPSECGGCADGEFCFLGECHPQCDPIRMPLPGPECFPEFVRYRVQAEDSFLVRGDTVISFLTDGVTVDPDTDQCLPDPTASTLLTSRIRLGADADETFNHPVWGIADCDTDQPLPGSPNPCRITVPRRDDPTSLFHQFEYRGQPVEAIRFSNPVFSLVLDLTSLINLAADRFDDQTWPRAFAEFRRSRIPRGYRVEFATQSGYTPYNDGVIVNNVPLAYPVRVINAPEIGVVYTVDAGGRGGTRGIRGQVMRVNLTPSVLADDQFLVR